MRFVVALALVGLTTSAFAQSAPATRTYSGYYFFGDSLTDSGNLFAATGSPPPPYYQGRVSNGPTYAEYLVPGLQAALTAPAGASKLNFAFAGATVGTSVVSPPNITMQLGMYQARGIASNPNSLYVLLAGANDLLNAVGVPANQNAGAMTNVGVGASTAVAGAVQSLAGLGAKNILVLSLPDISKTPRFTTGSAAAASAIMQTGVTAYNNDLKGRIGGLNLGADVNVTVFDLGSVFATILANPQRFGFSITNQEYLGILSSGGNPGDVNQYMFWDGIHPTTKTHQLFGSILGEVINPEFVLGTAATQGVTTLSATDMSLDSVVSRLDTTRAAPGRHSADGWISYTYKSGGFNRDSYRNGTEIKGSVLSAGFDLNVGSELLVGVAISAESMKVELGAPAGTHQMRGQLVSLYGQWKSGAFFADAVASYGSNDFQDIKRTTAFAGLQTSGKTDGSRSAATARIGYDFVASENLRFTPYAGVRYAKAKLDGYAETGVTSLNYAFGDQSVKAFEGLFGANLDWSVPNRVLPFVLSASLVYQKDMGDDTRTLTGRLAETVSARASITVKDGLGETFKYGLRASGLVSKSWGWSAGYVADQRQDGDAANQFSFSLHTGF